MKNKIQIKVNWNDLKNIEKAEKTKFKLENQGYTLLVTNAGLTITTLTYILKNNP